jgi:epoxyqueuosine reductase QueG
MSQQASAQPKAWIENLVRAYCATDRNTLNMPTGEPAWGEPLVGYARGDDPLFARLKDDIGPFYWTPEEAFHLAHPNAEVTASALSVIVYVLPQTKTTRQDQSRESRLPAERWARSRFYGEHFNCALRLYLAEQLTEAGYPAVAPERLADFAYRQSSRYGLASNWSERHTAWVAGLGTFGLSDGLITKLGKAVRFGSVVANIDLDPSPRPYPGHQDWCLWYADGRCGACIKRCPINAITHDGHDKTGCFDYIRQVTAPFVKTHYGTDATPCGLCQANIPCESQKPL